MLETIVVLIIVLWLIGVLFGIGLPVIHFFLLGAVVLLLLSWLNGRT